MKWHILQTCNVCCTDSEVYSKINWCCLSMQSVNNFWHTLNLFIYKDLVEERRLFVLKYLNICIAKNIQYAIAKKLNKINKIVDLMSNKFDFERYQCPFLFFLLFLMSYFIIILNYSVYIVWNGHFKIKLSVVLDYLSLNSLAKS